MQMFSSKYGSAIDYSCVQTAGKSDLDLIPPEIHLQGWLSTLFLVGV